MTSHDRKPCWAWPNLLSLDAPLVAAAWLFMLAKTWGVDYHENHNYILLGLVVWVAFVADRLLDGWVFGDSPKLSDICRFYRARRLVFGVAAVLAACVALGVALSYTPVALAGYLVGLGLLMAGYFAMALFAVPEMGQVSYSKSILGGASLAFGTAMVAHVYLPGQGAAEMIRTEEFAVFVVLSILAMSAMDLWRHAAESGDEEVRVQDEMALSLPLVLLAGAAFYFAQRGGDHGTRAFFHAVLTASALLFVLNRVRSAFALETLKSLAAAALLVPLGVFLLVR